MRGATSLSFSVSLSKVVSIHAPHAGRDDVIVIAYGANVGFNPRAPCGARRVLYVDTEQEKEFQSTRPMRGATQHRLPRVKRERVSIHAPHAGRDSGKAYEGRKDLGFQSTRPMRGATPPLLFEPTIG